MSRPARRPMLKTAAVSTGESTLFVDRVAVGMQTVHAEELNRLRRLQCGAYLRPGPDTPSGTAPYRPKSARCCTTRAGLKILLAVSTCSPSSSLPSGSRLKSSSISLLPPPDAPSCIKTVSFSPGVSTSADDAWQQTALMLADIQKHRVHALFLAEGPG